MAFNSNNIFCIVQTYTRIIKYIFEPLGPRATTGC